jgi:hypothetical protein
VVPEKVYHFRARDFKDGRRRPNKEPNITDLLMEHSRQVIQRAKDDPEGAQKRLNHALAFREEYFKTHDPHAPMANALCEIAYQKFLKDTGCVWQKKTTPPPPPY